MKGDDSGTPTTTPTAAASAATSTTFSPTPVSPRAARFARAGGLPVVLGSLRAALQAHDGSRAWGAAVGRGARLAAAAAQASPGCWRALAMVERADAVCVPCELLLAALRPSPSNSSSSSLGAAALAVPALLDLLLDLVQRDAAAAGLLLQHGGLAPAAEVMGRGAEALLPPQRDFPTPSSPRQRQQQHSRYRRPSSSSSLASSSHFSSPGSSLPSSPRCRARSSEGADESSDLEVGDCGSVGGAFSAAAAVAAAAEGARATAATLCAAVLAGVPKLRRGGGGGSGAGAGIGGSSAALSSGMLLGDSGEEEEEVHEGGDEGEDASLWPAAPGATRLAEAAALALYALTSAAAAASGAAAAHPPPLLMLPPNASQLLAAAKGALGVLLALAARGGAPGTAAARGALSLSLLQPASAGAPLSSSSSCPCAYFLSAVAQAAKAWGDAELAAEALELREELAVDDEAEGEKELERQRTESEHGGGGGLFSSLFSSVGAWWS